MAFSVVIDPGAIQDISEEHKEEVRKGESLVEAGKIKTRNWDKAK